MAALLLLVPFCSLTGCEVGRELQDGGKLNYEKYAELEPIELPEIRVQTDGGEEVDSKEEYRRMTVTVEGENPLASEGTAWDDLSAPMRGKIRGRGNSSWDMLEKKSYRLKFSEKVRLLGVGKGAHKDYVLLANAREKSMLRNYAILRLGQALRFSFSSDSTFVHFYLNGEYLGVYQLCEQCEEGEERIPLSEDPAGAASPLPSGEAELAFLIELDKRARSDGDFGLDYFCCNDYEIPFAVKSDATREETEKIEAYIEATDRAILSGDIDRVERYIDIDSFVDMYLLEEFSKDRDVGFSSMFFAKRKGGKLVCTCPWDFDLALGNDNGADTGEDHKSPEGVMVQRNRWFEALYECEWFRHLVRDRLTELLPLLDDLLDEVITVGYRLRDAAQRNYERWEVLDKRLYMEPAALAELPDYISHVQYLAEWICERRDWMQEYYITTPLGALSGGKTSDTND